MHLSTRIQTNASKHRRWPWLGAVLLSGLVGLAAGRAIRISWVGAVAIVDGESMEPTYPCGARVYTCPVSTPLRRGDVVLLDDHRGGYALKRIIGLPGESLALWRGQIFINGRMLREPYLPKHTFTLVDERSNTAGVRLSPVQYFVLGDNRMRSVDSRWYGPVEASQIKSRVPLPQATLRADFAPYSLPASGQRMIRAL